MTPADPHRSNPAPHFRLYRSPDTGRATIICVQDFDYPDYDEARFLSPHAWATEDEATAAFLAYREPAASVEADGYRVTLTISAGGNPAVEFASAGTVSEGVVWPVVTGAIKGVAAEGLGWVFDAAQMMTALDRADERPPC